ncbi:hypothetical protein DWY22_08355 [Heyndrickxia coagulans]|nr:hypothetical protein DWY22_08355 [Heyndrickxia coagulans]RGR97960.1 hypothetical protein DWY16_09335 [Heyndrickxia coagulans]
MNAGPSSANRQLLTKLANRGRPVRLPEACPAVAIKPPFDQEDPAPVAKKATLCRFRFLRHFVIE